MFVAGCRRRNGSDYDLQTPMSRTRAVQFRRPLHLSNIAQFIETNTEAVIGAAPVQFPRRRRRRRHIYRFVRSFA